MLPHQSFPLFLLLLRLFLSPAALAAPLPSSLDATPAPTLGNTPHPAPVRRAGIYDFEEAAADTASETKDIDSSQNDSTEHDGSSSHMFRHHQSTENESAKSEELESEESGSEESESEKNSEEEGEEKSEVELELEEEERSEPASWFANGLPDVTSGRRNPGYGVDRYGSDMNKLDPPLPSQAKDLVTTQPLEERSTMTRLRKRLHD